MPANRENTTEKTVAELIIREQLNLFILNLESVSGGLPGLAAESVPIRTPPFWQCSCRFLEFAELAILLRKM